MYTQYVCSFLVLSCSAMDTASDYESEKKLNFFFREYENRFWRRRNSVTKFKGGESISYNKRLEKPAWWMV